MDSDDDEGIDNNNWNFEKSDTAATDAQGASEDDEEDDEWAAIRGSAETKIALDKERKEREEKMRAEAAAAKEKSLAEAAERGKKVQEERKAKAEEERLKREMKEKEDRDRSGEARKKALQDLSKVTATVDMEKERDIMKDFEQSFMDKDLGGGASPSSDFGF